MSPPEPPAPVLAPVQGAEGTRVSLHRQHPWDGAGARGSAPCHRVIPPGLGTALAPGATGCARPHPGLALPWVSGCWQRRPHTHHPSPSSPSPAWSCVPVLRRLLWGPGAVLQSRSQPGPWGTPTSAPHTPTAGSSPLLSNYCLFKCFI